MAIWIQPYSPRASRLSGCRLRSNPSRVNTCAKDSPRNSGPAAAPAASRVAVGTRRVVPACVSVTLVISISLSSAFTDASIGSTGIRHPVPRFFRNGRLRPDPAAAPARARCAVSAAARSNSARASSCRPSFASRSPRTLGSRWYARQRGLVRQRVDQLEAGRGPVRHARRRPRGSARPPASGATSPARRRARRSAPSRSPRRCARARGRRRSPPAARRGRARRRALGPRRAPRGPRRISSRSQRAAVLIEQQDRLAVRRRSGRACATPGSPSARPARAPRARPAASPASMRPSRSASSHSAGRIQSSPAVAE